MIYPFLSIVKTMGLKGIARIVDEYYQFDFEELYLKITSLHNGTLYSVFVTFCKVVNK